MKKVTIVSPTTGNPLFEKCAESVQNQDCDDFTHLIVVDGEEHRQKIFDLSIEGPNQKYLLLPDPTGKNQFNGHRIYAATSYLVNTPYICWLDEDNWLEPNHISSMLMAIEGKDWAFTLRKIVSMEGKFLCYDDCESLGKYPSVLGYHLVDVSCFCISQQMAFRLSPLWWRKAREFNVEPADRTITRTLLSCANLSVGETQKYTLNYRIGSRSDSVSHKFFQNGNVEMRKIYPNGNFPWRAERRA